MYQNILYNEYLPAIIGPYVNTQMTPYSGYDNTTDPSTSAIFASAALRYGHSGTLQYYCLDQNGCSFECVPKWQAFGFNDYEPPFIGTNGPNGFTTSELVYSFGGYQNFLASLVYQPQGQIDQWIDSSFRNLGIGFFPIDVSAVDIARGRINGLPDYHTIRAFYYTPIYGLANCTYNSNKSIDDPIECFTYIHANVTEAQNVKNVYGRIDRIDPFVGMLYEDHLNNTAMGPTMANIIIDEYERKRDGDRFFYLNNQFDTNTLNQIKSTTISGLINQIYNMTLTNFLYVMENTCANSVPPTQSSASSSPTSSASSSGSPTSNSGSPTSASSSPTSASATTKTTSASKTPVTETKSNAGSLIASIVMFALFMIL